MALRSLVDHNAARHRAHTAESRRKRTGIECPRENCSGELFCPPPFSEFPSEEIDTPPLIETFCPKCNYTGRAYV